MQTNWKSLSPEEKQERRFAQWMNPSGVEFVSPEAKAAYEARVTRIKDAIQLRKTPDRVPVIPFHNFLPGSYAGYTPYEVMYDYGKLADAWKKYTFDFEPDAYTGAFQPGSGKVFDLIDYKMYQWPGHGIAQTQAYQCLEAEYMKAQDYDALIDDPSDFWLRTFLPRTIGAWAPLSGLAPLIELMELPFVGPNLAAYGQPAIREALKKIVDAGEEAAKWWQVVLGIDKALNAGGFPGNTGGATKAPFDIIGDTLRGTRGIMLDTFRCPDKVLKAVDRLTPLAIKNALAGVNASGCPIVFMPLHKGADGFLSEEQFKKFYWPSLRTVIHALVNEGAVPFLFAEGGYNSRLEVIHDDLPKGTTLWLFDHTDMKRAKEVLGDVACIMGNVPLSLLELGTPEETDAYCRGLIDTAGKDGGFILSNGAVIDEAKPECLRAMIQCAKEYGRYS